MEYGTVCCKIYSVYHCLGWKDAKIPCSASTWLYWMQPGPWRKKRTCYKTETIWGNKNNIVAVTKPSNSICNGRTGSLQVTVILADSRYINQQSSRVKHECRQKGDRSPRDWIFLLRLVEFGSFISSSLSTRVVSKREPTSTGCSSDAHQVIRLGGKKSVGQRSPRREYKCVGKYVSWVLCASSHLQRRIRG